MFHETNQFGRAAEQGTICLKEFMVLHSLLNKKVCITSLHNIFSQLSTILPAHVAGLQKLILSRVYFECKRNVCVRERESFSSLTDMDLPTQAIDGFWLHNASVKTGCTINIYTSGFVGVLVLRLSGFISYHHASCVLCSLLFS